MHEGGMRPARLRSFGAIAAQSSSLNFKPCLSYHPSLIRLHVEPGDSLHPNETQSVFQNQSTRAFFQNWETMLSTASRSAQDWRRSVASNCSLCAVSGVSVRWYRSYIREYTPARARTGGRCNAAIRECLECRKSRRSLK